MEVLKDVYPNIISGLAPTALDHIKLDVPSNKGFHYTPVMNKPDSYYLNGGVTTVVQNTGMSVAGTNFSARSVFIENPEMFKNGSGGRSVSEMDQSAIYGLVDSFLQNRDNGFKVVTAGWNEAYEGLLPWRLDPLVVPAQCKWAAQRMSEKLAPFGGLFFNTYDGVVNVLAATDDIANCEPLRDPLSDPRAAFQFARTHTGFGNQFFPDRFFEFSHGIINCYWAGATSSFKRLLKAMFELHIARQALVSQGSNARLMGFGLAGVSEFTNYLETYSFNITGGRFDSVFFPQYADSVQVILGFIIQAIVEETLLWEDTLRRDTNPDYHYANTGQYTFHGSGGNEVGLVHNAQPDQQAGYLTARYGGHDAFMVGQRMYGKTSRWAGQSFVYAPTRRVGSANWNSGGLTSLVDRSHDHEPIALVFRYNDHRSAFIFDLAGRPGDYREYEVDLDGGILPITLGGGEYKHRLIKL